MRRVFAVLLCIFFLAGCTQEQEAAAPTPSNEPISSDEPAPTPQATAAPEPTPVPIESPEDLRQKGKAAILGSIPAEYLLDIPVDEIKSLEATLTSDMCTVSIGWATELSSRDAALLLDEKLPYELVQSDDDWRNPDGAEYPKIRLKQGEGGLTINYLLEPSQVAGTLLTGSFPVEAFKDIPDTLDINTAERRAQFDHEQDIWNYELNWVLGTDEGEALEIEIPELYQAKDGFRFIQELGHTTVSFNISQNEELFLDVAADDEYRLSALYQYKSPGHSQSELVQAFIQDPLACLLSDLPAEYPTILNDPRSAVVTIYFQDNFMEYRISAVDNEDHQAVADRAAQITGEAFTETDHGSYESATDDYTMTIKFNDGDISLELGKQIDDGFTHPYINDMYPSSYEPALPEELDKEPYSIATGFSQRESGIDMNFEKSWQFDDEQTAQTAFDAMKEACKDYHSYTVEGNDGNQTIYCRIKEYGFMCRLSEKGGMWYITFQFNYR